MSKSIISNAYKCIICNKNYNLHRHHIYYGTANRRLSEKYGCWCYLCAEHHNMSNKGVHFNRFLDDKLKAYCQQILEQEHGWTKNKMIEIFGRNYL